MPDIDALHRPEPAAVRTDDDVVDLVVSLLERPVRRQCWVVFLADRGQEIPLVMPIADLPYQPDDHVEDFAALAADLVEQTGASEVVLAWERPGARGLSPVDWEWVDAMACVLDEHHVRLRGQVVVHDGGAAMVEFDQDEVTEAAA